MSDERPMEHTIKLRMVTDGPVPYGHKSWSEVIESILLSEVTAVVEVEVLEDWV